MKKILVALGAWLALTCAAMAQAPMVPNGAGTQPKYHVLFCQNVAGNTVCTSDDGSNWGCTTAQPAVCTVPATLVNGEGWTEGCSAGAGGGGGQSGAGNAGGGGGGGGACTAAPSWRVQLTASAQLNVTVGVPGVGGVIGSNATGSAATVTSMSGAGLVTPFPNLTAASVGNAGSAGTGGAGALGGGIGAPAGGASGSGGTAVTSVRGPSYIPGAGGGGGGPSAGTAGTGGSAITVAAGPAGTGNGAGGGGGSCFKSIGNTGGTAGSSTPAPAGWCAGGGGGATNQAGANGSAGYLALGAVY
jgi:hypothetical protein